MNLAVLSQGLFSYDSGDLPHATFDQDSFWGPISNVTHFWCFPREELLFPTRPGIPVCSSSDTIRKLCFRCLPFHTDSPRTVLLPFWPSQNRKLKLRKGKNFTQSHTTMGGLDCNPGLTSESMLFDTYIISIWKFTWIFFHAVMKNNKNHICWKLGETRSSYWVRKSDAEKRAPLFIKGLRTFIET